MILTTLPTATEARAMMAEYLAAHAKRIDGQLCPMDSFARCFISWVDRQYGPAASQWFANKSRVRRVLTDLGWHVGHAQPENGPTVYGIGNMAHRGAKQIASCLILEADAPGLQEYLQPTDWFGGTIDEPSNLRENC
jgi:hypothetical protein